MAATTRPIEPLRGTLMRETAMTSAPASIAGRRPTVSTKRPTGMIAAVCTTAATAKTVPVQVALSPRPAVMTSGISALRTPVEFQPCAKLATRAAR